MEKQRWEDSETRSQKVRRSEKRKNEKKEDASARKGRKVAIHYVFPMICGSRGSKSRLAKAARFGPFLEVDMSKKSHAVEARSIFPNQNVQKHTVDLKTCTPSWREAHFQLKMYKTQNVRTTFGSSGVEKVHAVVARSAFPRQKSKNLQVRTTFWRSDVEKMYAAVARSRFWSQKCEKLTGTTFWRSDVEKKRTLTNYLPTYQTN